MIYFCFCKEIIAGFAFLRQFFFSETQRRCSFQAPLDRNDALAEMERAPYNGFFGHLMILELQKWVG